MVLPARTCAASWEGHQGQGHQGQGTSVHMVPNADPTKFPQPSWDSKKGFFFLKNKPFKYNSSSVK